MQAFTYDILPTDGKFIRILTLRPGHFDSIIQCSLRTESLEQKPSYEALSYVWGDKDPPGTILLQGIDFNVTPNLENALRYIRYEDRDRELWIDAICINQDDLDERTAQVRMMAQIYATAETTVSWLGVASEDSDEALELMRRLGSWTKEHDDVLFDDDFEDQTRIGQQDRETQNAIDVIEALGFPLTSQNWPAFWRLLERPYWTRVWIIQELAARGRILRSSGVLYCGAQRVKRVDLDYCCSLILYIVLYGRITPRDGALPEPMRSMLVNGHPPGLTMVQTLAACSDNVNRKMEWLLRVTSRFKATDPRDKLFALIGLAAESNLVDPDYTKDLATVLRDFVESHISRYANLTALLGNRYKVSIDGPSWLPDMSAAAVHGGSGLVPAEQNSYFQAAGTSRPVVTFYSDKSDQLSAKGLLVGKIDRVIGPMKVVGQGFNGSTREDIWRISKSVGQMQFFEGIKSFRKSLHPSDSSLLWRTLCLDGDWTNLEPSFPAPDEYAGKLDVVFGEKPVDPDFMTSAPESVRYTSFVEPYMRSLQAAMTNRTFITINGGYERRMGVGPHEAQPGDIVAVLFGAVFCVVLRPVEGRFRLVGDAYVQGIMRGEKLKGDYAASARTFHII
jgi:hypothetical protein